MSGQRSETLKWNRYVWPSEWSVANGPTRSQRAMLCVKQSGLPFEDLSAVSLDVVGRTSWLPTEDTYQRRRQYGNEVASVEYVPNMSRKACERSPNRPNQSNLERHVEAFRCQSGSNPLECVTCAAVAPPQVVEGVGTWIMAVEPSPVATVAWRTAQTGGSRAMRVAQGPRPCAPLLRAWPHLLSQTDCTAQSPLLWRLACLQRAEDGSELWNGSRWRSHRHSCVSTWAAVVCPPGRGDKCQGFRGGVLDSLVNNISVQPSTLSRVRDGWRRAPRCPAPRSRGTVHACRGNRSSASLWVTGLVGHRACQRMDRVSLSGHSIRQSTNADCGVRHTSVARSRRSECAWEGHGGRCRSSRWQELWEQPTMSVDWGPVRSAVRLRGPHEWRCTLNVPALCGPFRNGGASALFRRRRTVCPLLLLCRTSRDTASRHARLPPFKVCRWRHPAVSPTPPSTSWFSVLAGGLPVARVFFSSWAPACYGPWHGRDGASRGGSGTPAAVCDSRRRLWSGNVPAGRDAHDWRRLRVAACVGSDHRCDAVAPAKQVLSEYGFLAVSRPEYGYNPEYVAEYSSMIVHW